MRAHQFVPAGDTIAPVNKDIQPFLLYFLPKGQSLNWRTMNAIVKQFHLAFKGMETKEIYDVLMEQLVATIKGYDPNYTEKVRMVVEAIENELSKRKQFRFADVDRHLEFDCHRYSRLLGRLGILRIREATAVRKGSDAILMGKVNGARTGAGKGSVRS